MTDSLKHSKTEFSMASNIVTLDNLNELGEKFFRKTTHKGKLYKGPNWTAYNKENLGSIPRTVEKALVEDKKGMTKVGFSTQTERFFPKIDSAKECPGPGTYNISGDMDFDLEMVLYHKLKDLMTRHYIIVNMLRVPEIINHRKQVLYQMMLIKCS